MSSRFTRSVLLYSSDPFFDFSFLVTICNPVGKIRHEFENLQKRMQILTQFIVGVLDLIKRK